MNNEQTASDRQRYADAENEAREAKRGLWQDPQSSASIPTEAGLLFTPRAGTCMGSPPAPVMGLSIIMDSPGLRAPIYYGIGRRSYPRVDFPRKWSPSGSRFSGSVGPAIGHKKGRHREYRPLLFLAPRDRLELPT